MVVSKKKTAQDPVLSDLSVQVYDFSSSLTILRVRATNSKYYSLETTNQEA